ncbi:MAG: sulfatase, partial [Sorangiineae bacterium]|nr:sulfatase [Sorangiineae bacterium]
VARAGGALAGLAALVALLTRASAHARDVQGSTPELGFVQSLDDGAPSAEPIESEPSARPAERAAPPGPGLAAGAEWARVARARGRRADRRPNVILVTLESIALGHLGYQGYPRPTTPNLDRIAKESLRARRAWTTATHSNYAQPAILSSLFPRRTTGFDVYRRLDYPRFLFHDLLASLGYETATISSQDENWQGMRRFEDTGTPQYFWDSRSFTGSHLDSGSERVVPDAETMTHALEWLTAHARGPFGLYLNLQMTHFPYKLPPGAPAPWQPVEVRRGFNYLGYSAADHERAVNRYDAALRYVDAQLGRLERFLSARGLAERTLLIITADHGELFHEHGMVTHGKTLYEGEARVPLLVRFPGRVEPGELEAPVSTLDIMPTIAELLGVPPHPSFQGTSLLASSELAGERPAIFLNIQGLRSADAIVCWPWKLIVDRTGRRSQLFNLEADPAERHDRLAGELALAAALRATLEEQMRAQVRYHEPRGGARPKTFAPRLLGCPALPRESESVAGAR